MADSASAVATHAGSATGGAQRAARSAHEGGEVIRQAIQQMRAISVSVDEAAERVRQLSRSSEQISEIIEVIDQIADQTKLLALNAAIEAARAGDHGRGFAVVADSVRGLSETTSSATRDIAARLKGIHAEAVTTVKAMQAGNAHVTQTVQIAEQASVALREILETADQVGTMVHEIAAAAEQQSAMTVQVQSNMDEMDRITRQSAAATRQVAESCGELSQLAHELEGLIARFRLSGNWTETADAEPRSGTAAARWAAVMR
jgi:methyl-accepting chemotaxis protein